ncbi:hypothetical protein [Aliikangiella sp. IMCC44359]|uniref:hypothetical protein n=1 Tax=Aliikangiella sp. IMCC44359 TaxID=3459125 RepID=UPI00403B2575
MSEQKLLESLEQSYEAFMLPLRTGDGIVSERFNEFCNLLPVCSDSWKPKESIPVPAAMIFVEAFSSIISTSYLYDEHKREEIEVAAEKVNLLIHQCVS